MVELFQILVGDTEYFGEYHFSENHTFSYNRFHIRLTWMGLKGSVAHKPCGLKVEWFLLCSYNSFLAESIARKLFGDSYIILPEIEQ